jgi:hypothetical protein
MMKKGGGLYLPPRVGFQPSCAVGHADQNPGSSKAVDEHFYRPTDRTSLANYLATSTNLRRKS